MNEKKIGVLLLMSFYGTISLALRNIRLSSDNVALLRGLIGLSVVFLVKILFVKRMPENLSFKDWIQMIGSGIVTVVYWIAMNYAYRNAPVSIVTLCIYVAPSILMILSPLLFHEKRDRGQIFCFLCSTVGVVMIIGARFNDMEPGYVIGIGFAFITAFCTAAIQLLNKSVQKVDGINKAFVQCLTATIILIPYNLFGSGLHFGNETLTGWSAVAVLGAFYTGLGYCMNYFLLARMTGQEYAILTYMEPFIAMVLSVLYWGETVTGIQVLGAVILLGSTFVNEIREIKRSS